MRACLSFFFTRVTPFAHTHDTLWIFFCSCILSIHRRFSSCRDSNMVMSMRDHLQNVKASFPHYNRTLLESLARATHHTSGFYASTDWRHVLGIFLQSQQPRRCSTARYLVIEDFNENNGLGYTFLVLHTILLQAMWERRTLVFASTLLHPPLQDWRWCGTGTRDFRCYFEPWSHCEAYLSRRHYFQNASLSKLIPHWEGSSKNLEHRIVVLHQRKSRKRTQMWQIYHTWDNAFRHSRNGSAPRMGRSWWWALSFEVLLRFSPFIERQAIDFLERSGVRSDESFVVATVRHGMKSAEERIILVPEYETPLSRLLDPNCTNTNHVLVVTETAKVTTTFSAMCKLRGWNCFWTNQTRWNTKHDIWAPHAYTGRGISHPEEVAHIGYHSVLNLAISQRASALIGSVGSMWMRATIPFMQRFHGEPMTVCSLRGSEISHQWHISGRESGAVQRDLSTGATAVHQASLEGLDDPPERDVGDVFTNTNSGDRYRRRSALGDMMHWTYPKGPLKNYFFKSIMSLQIMNIIFERLVLNEVEKRFPVSQTRSGVCGLRSPCAFHELPSRPDSHCVKPCPGFGDAFAHPKYLM